MTAETVSKKKEASSPITVEQASKPVSAKVRVMALLHCFQTLQTSGIEPYSKERLEIERVIDIHARRIIDSNRRYQNAIGVQMGLLKEDDSTPKKITSDYLKLVCEDMSNNEKEGRSVGKQFRIDAKYRRIQERLNLVK
jgi:hypothetical protein